MSAPVLAYRLQPAPPAAFSDLDLVRVRSAVMTDGGAEVPAGARGTVVAVYGGGAAYEIEFWDGTDECGYGTGTVAAADLLPA